MAQKSAMAAPSLASLSMSFLLQQDEITVRFDRPIDEQKED
jgi:hypothetical protein